MSSGAARLWEAAERGDAHAVQLELDAGTHVDATGRTAWTALHRAADRGWINVLRVLLQHGASPTKTTETGHDTPLHLAAARGHSDIARELIRGGADYRSKARNGWTPLHAAMFHNHTEVARILIRAGADPIEKTVRGSTMRTLSEGGGSEKWSRGPRGDGSSLSGYADDGSSPRAASPGKERVNAVVAAREAALWQLRERRTAERERERIDGAEASLQQHISHQQRRDEKRRQLELSLGVRKSGTSTMMLPARSSSSPPSSPMPNSSSFQQQQPPPVASPRSYGGGAMASPAASLGALSPIGAPQPEPEPEPGQYTSMFSGR